MSSMPLVSVVITTYKRSEMLLRAIESVLIQTYKDIEVIVVDDGSPEPVCDSLQQIFGDRIRCVSHPQNLGAPAARNTGIRQSRGKYVAFLDDDDVWLPQKLEKQMLLFDEGVAMVFCGEAIYADGKLVRERPAKWLAGGNNGLLRYNPIGGTSVAVIDKKCLDDVKGFDEALQAAQDWDLWLRISQKHSIRCVPEVLICRHLHGLQISSSLKKRICGRMQFIEKHKDLLSTEPFSLAQNLRRLACLQYIDNNKEIANNYFMEAIRAYPFSRNNYICYFVSLFFPKKLADKILSLFAVSIYKDKMMYH